MGGVFPACPRGGRFVCGMISAVSTVRAVVVLACALLLAGCGASDYEFSKADPTGYDACQAFAQSRDAGGDFYRDGMDQAATLGVGAKTSGIREAIDDRDGGVDGAPVIPVLDDFEDACKGAGFDF